MDEKKFRLLLPAEEGNMILAREVGGGFAQLLDAPPAQVDDIKTALTEACNNSILHGYGGRSGTLSISGVCSEHALEFSVIDFGEGLSAASDNKGLGFGLPLIAAVSDEYEVKGGSEGGTKVRMAFGMNSAPTALGPDSDPGIPENTDSIVLEASLPGLTRRLAVAVGAAADLTVDRLSDLEVAMDLAEQQLSGTDAILAIRAGEDMRLELGPVTEPGEFELETFSRIGIAATWDRERNSLTISIVPRDV